MGSTSKIATETIMDKAAGKAGEDVEMAKGVDPTFFMDPVPGQ